MNNKNIFLGIIAFALFACSGGGDSVTATTDGGGGETGGNTGGTAQPVPTKILTELFTSTTCGPCTPQNNTLNKYSPYTMILFELYQLTSSPFLFYLKRYNRVSVVDCIL